MIEQLGNWQDLGDVDRHVVALLEALPENRRTILLDWSSDFKVCIEACIADYGAGEEEDGRKGKWLEYRVSNGLPGRRTQSNDADTHADAVEWFDQMVAERKTAR